MKCVFDTQDNMSWGCCTQWVVFISPPEQMLVLETNYFRFSTAGCTGGFFSLYHIKTLCRFQFRTDATVFSLFYEECLLFSWWVDVYCRIKGYQNLGLHHSSLKTFFCFYFPRFYCVVPVTAIMTLCTQNNFRKMLLFARVNLKSFLLCKRTVCFLICLEAGFSFQGWGEERWKLT